MEKIIAIPFWSKFAESHGFLAMLSLILFGASLSLYFFSDKIKSALIWFKVAVTALFVDILLLDMFGLTIYVPYRAEGGPRTLLKASAENSWLHNIVFEHKEFLAFAPLILTLIACLIVWKLGDSFSDKGKVYWLRKSVLSALFLSLVFVLIVAGEAVLVTKTAPL